MHLIIHGAWILGARNLETSLGFHRSSLPAVWPAGAIETIARWSYTVLCPPLCRRESSK